MSTPPAKTKSPARAKIASADRQSDLLGMLEEALGPAGNTETAAKDAAPPTGGSATNAPPRRRSSDLQLAGDPASNVAAPTESAQDGNTPRNAEHPSPQAFTSPQMTLFRAFSGATGDRRKQSNTVALWDILPRYSLDRRDQQRMRSAEGFLSPVDMDVGVIDGVPMAMTIYPGFVKMKDGSSRPFFPGQREELVEHALRKLAAQKMNGFYDGGRGASGVRFSITELRAELADHGHQMEHAEIVEALEIMAGSGIEVRVSGPGGRKVFARNNYLTGLVGVTRDDYLADTGAKWHVTFHPLVTHAIESIGYRQFNYERLMACSHKLARWLLMKLSNQYTQASAAVPFRIRFSTIKAGSKSLDGYQRDRGAYKAVEEAWLELKRLGAIDSIHQEPIKDESSTGRGRRPIIDIDYLITPTADFVREQIASNARKLSSSSSLPAADA